MLMLLQRRVSDIARFMDAPRNQTCSSARAEAHGPKVGMAQRAGRLTGIRFIGLIEGDLWRRLGRTPLSKASFLQQVPDPSPGGAHPPVPGAFKCPPATS